MTSTAWQGVDGRDTSDRVVESTPVRTSARIGLVARGVLYALVGVLALRLAFGDRSDRADKSGALAAVARQPFGKWLLIVLAAGFAAYAVWVAVRIFAVDDDSAAKTWAKRVAYAGRAIVYGALCVGAVQAVGQSSEQTQNSSSQQEKGWTATVLGWPFGRALVVAAGVAIIGGGVVFVHRGFTQKWRDPLNLSSASQRARQAVVTIGVAGWVGRGIVFGLVGAFLVRAALQFDPKDAVGLDGALRELANTGWGRWLLFVVALGLFAFGTYSMLEARYRRVDDA
jgi:hypothetical protein